MRPHRDSGFVLRAERLDSKTIIHNYGHAGAGMSLGWGCGVMVAEMAQETGQRRVAVIGCGSPGLTTARQLQRRGFDVTIYAMTVPPDTTSNMSLAGFTPTTALVNNERRTPAWDAQFVRAAEISYRQLQLMVSQNYGVYWIDSYNATDNPTPGQGGGRGRRRRFDRTCCRIICGRTATGKCSARGSIRSRPDTRCARRRCRSSRRSTSMRSSATS